MKIFKYSLLICALVFLTKCSPDDDGTFGEKINRTSQLIGTWKIKEVYQIDLDAEKKGFPDFATRVEITNVLANMPFSDFEMTLTEDMITTSIGLSPMNFVINEGNGIWSWISNEEIDKVNQELGINASNGINTVINGETVQLLVSTYLGLNNEVPTLSLSYQRVDNAGSPVLRYEYILEKQ